MHSINHTHPVSTRVLGALLAVAAGLLAQSPLHAAASFPPGPEAGLNKRWDTSSSLKPGSILGDSTSFDGTKDPKNGDTLLWHGLDIEKDATGAYLFSATGQGLQIYNLANPSAPAALGYIYGWISGGAFPSWNYSDKDWYIKHVDAPEGFTNLTALTMEDQGFAIVRTDVKSAPIVAYQRLIDTSKVHAFTVGQTHYAYASNGEVYLFNMSNAASLNRCLEMPPVTSCPGVYMGVVPAFGNVSSLDGTGKFAITSKIGSAGNVKIWDLSLPAAPSLLLEIAGSTKAAAIWKLGSSYFAAKLDLAGKQLTIYNVSCIASGSCSGAPQVWTGQVSATNGMNYVTASTDAGRAYLYLGADDLGSCVPQREFIFDVTNPSSPAELTPKIHPDGYWGWYYMGCPDPAGFSLVGPRIGEVYGGYLYRAANTLLDSHLIAVSGPPAANFSWTPAEVYPGTPVQFTDQSAGIPTTWAWTFQDGTPASFDNQAPPSVTFASQGVKSISLDVSNAQGPGTPSTKELTVLNPAPQVAGVSVSPANPVVCQPITFTANGAAGQPVLSFAWDVKDSAQATVHIGSANPDTWNTELSAPLPQPGSYTAMVTVNNAGGPPATASVVFTLGGLAALPAEGAFTPACTNCVDGAPPAGVAQLSAGDIPGATAWSWDCGSGFGPYVSDPVAGPVHSCSYTSTGAKTVKVKVKNCVEPEKTSAGLGITINQITPLKALFAVNGLCSGGVCFATAGQPLGFVDLSTGAEFWDYDWNGDGIYEDAGNTAPQATHTYATQGTFTPKLKVRRGASEQDVYTLPTQISVAAASPGAISVAGPSSGQPNAALSFSALASGSCNPSPTGWSWTAAGGTVTNGTTSSVTISWSSTGNKTISVTNSACSGVSGSKSVTISTPGPGPGPGPTPGTLKAEFSFTPTSPAAGQAVSFNGSASTGSPTAYIWDFGDGTPYGEGAQVAHTFAQTGTYLVQLSVTKPGNCPPAPFCSAALTKTVIVGTGEPPLGAAFDTSAPCISEFGLNSCSAEVGKPVTFTDQSTGNPTSWSWNFGDGDTATGTSVTHTFTKPGPFTVTLTIGRGSNAATAGKAFNVVGEPEPETSTVILPWIAQSRGVLIQSSDLYVHNPGTTAMEIVLEFRRRGLPEINPPQATRTIEPGATLYAADVLKELFNREDIVGFVALTKMTGDAEPVMTSFNTTFGSNGSQFGQTIPGISLSQKVAEVITGKRVQYLVGLNDNSDREAYFGVTNPNSGQAIYRLKFFDSLGRPVGTPSGDLSLSSFGFKQFQPAEIRSKFGLSSLDDYQVEVETVSGKQLYPFGANVRVTSDDPSYLGVGRTNKSRVYLVGAMSTPGINNTSWQTDVVLANVGTQVALADVSFLKAGLSSQPTTPLHLTLQPGEIRRLENIVGEQWNVLDSVGVVIVDSDSPNSVFPIVQGESYETTNANPAMRFGQFMAEFTDEDAAGVGEAQYLVGLRQDAQSRTTYWLYNPSNQPGSYDLIYRALDGTELGRISAASLGAGKFRQISPSQHPLPAAGAADGGFTLQVVVRSGKVLAAAQVINNQTNDPAYLKGQTQ